MTLPAVNNSSREEITVGRRIAAHSRGRIVGGAAGRAAKKIKFANVLKGVRGCAKINIAELLRATVFR